MVDTSDDWIQTRTGIRERRILDDDAKASAFMGAEAARVALAKRGADADTVDVIVLATATPDMLFPATACLIQDAIGATNAWGYDLLAACSGFLFALTTGASFIESGRAERVLVIGADKMSSITDYTDRSTCILFGDAAGAVLLEPADSMAQDGAPEDAAPPLGLLDTVHFIDGSGAEHLRMEGGGSLNPATHDTVDRRMHYLFQDGRPVFRYAVTAMADACEQVMQRNDLTGEDVRYLVPHQANHRIISAAAQRMNLPMERVMINIHRYGNTTTATIPLCLADWEHELRRGDGLVLTSFGGGFTWGASYLRWAYDGTDGAGASG
jgi:3-oxoacyl-[acyl-carrier-protein] synthase-3